MNDQSTLEALGQGFKVQRSVNPGKAELVAAVVNTPAQTEVVQIGKPTDFSNINMQNLVANNDNVIEFNFRNLTGATQTVYLSSLFGLPGEHEGFNRAASAVDYASFLETSTDYQSNAGAVKGFNSRTKIMPVIIKSITIQTSDLDQSNEKLIIGYLTKTLTPMETSIIPTLCDACVNNNINAYTKEFAGPFGVGQANYVGYRVRNNQSVMMRVELIGEGKVTQFVAE